MSAILFRMYSNSVRLIASTSAGAVNRMKQVMKPVHDARQGKDGKLSSGCRPSLACLIPHLTKDLWLLHITRFRSVSISRHSAALILQPNTCATVHERSLVGGTRRVSSPPD